MVMVMVMVVAREREKLRVSSVHAMNPCIKLKNCRSPILLIIIEDATMHHSATPTSAEEDDALECQVQCHRAAALDDHARGVLKVRDGPPHNLH